MRLAAEPAEPTPAPTACGSDPTKCHAVFVDSIPSRGSERLRSISFEGKTWVFQANQYSATVGSLHVQNSTIWTWDDETEVRGDTLPFQWFPPLFPSPCSCVSSMQALVFNSSIPTAGSQDFSPFIIDGELFVASANYYNGALPGVCAYVLVLFHLCLSSPLPSVLLCSLCYHSPLFPLYIQLLTVTSLVQRFTSSWLESGCNKVEVSRPMGRGVLSTW